MKLVPIHELKVNDILDQDIENDYGVVVVSQGSVITRNVIEKIERMDINFVYVKSDNSVRR